MAVQTEDEVHAKRDGCPVWLSRRTEGTACHMVSVPPPCLQKGEFLFQYFNGRRFLGLLLLLNFLRQIVADVDWQSPSSRACFIFDDPSLYWTSYGFLNYRLLSEHARKYDYFASIATVPLDTWSISHEVAEIFRANGPRLSLVIHGNNHIPDELLRPNDRGGYLAAAAQAMRRWSG